MFNLCKSTNLTNKGVILLIKIIIFTLLVNLALAEEGRVTTVLGDNTGYLLRNNQQIPLKEGLPIELGDSINSANSVVLIYLRPTTQISISKNTEIKITKNLIEEDLDKEKSNSVIEFVKGLVRLQVTKDSDLEINQQIAADGVSFAVRGTEFEVSKVGEDFDLDVMEGEVEVISPFVQTFVPEIVKANEGFKFSKKERKFQRRKFKEKFSGHPKFTSKDDIRKLRKLTRKSKKKSLKSVQKRHRKKKSKR